MINENVQKWVDALRSGVYNQISGKMASCVGHCCLGVACEVYIKENPNESIQKTPDIRLGKNHGFKFGNYSGFLPNKVAEWYGLRTTQGAFKNEHGFYSLATMNDNDKSFEEIADVIESAPQGLFGKLNTIFKECEDEGSSTTK